MMTQPKMIGHNENVPDTMPIPIANRAPAQQIKVQVVPTGGPEDMTGGPARVPTRDLQDMRKACLLN